jgi:hypothetical protein
MSLLLLQVNSASLDNVTHEQAVGILKSSSDTVVLLVYRDSSSFVYEGLSPPHSPVDETGKLTNVKNICTWNLCLKQIPRAVSLAA